MIPELVGVDTAHPMVLSTSDAVGERSRNLREDVRVVQTLLNLVPATTGGPIASPNPARPCAAGSFVLDANSGAVRFGDGVQGRRPPSGDTIRAPQGQGLAVDGLVGPRTIAAIRMFQQAQFGKADGRVDARHRTIRRLVELATSQGPLAPMPGLSPPTPNDLAIASTPLDRSAPWLNLQLPDAPRSGRSALVQAVGNSTSPKSTGFGSPFTFSGWTIDNNAFTVDASVKDTGVYLARIEIFQEADPTQRQKLSIAGGFKSFSKSADAIGFDIALPSMDATRGRIFRGILGFAPLFGTSFSGVVGFNFASAQAAFGVGVTLFQFGWVPAGPPGMCLGFAFVAGTQAGMPGIGVGGGTGLCVPL